MQVEKPDTAVPWKSSVPGSTGAPLRRMGKSRLAFDLQKGYTIPGAARRDPQCRWVDTCAGMGERQLFHAAVLFSFSDGSIALLFEWRNTFLGVFYFFVHGFGEIPAFAELVASIGKRPARDCLDAGSCSTVWNNAYVVLFAEQSIRGEGELEKYLYLARFYPDQARLYLFSLAASLYT